MTASDEQALLRQRSQPLQPLATGLVPQLKQLAHIRAVLFDIYGTLLISGCGEIGTATMDDRGSAFASALQAVGIRARHPQTLPVERLHQTIRQHHQRSRESGTEFPEVDIVEVWRDTLAALKREQLLVNAELDEWDAELDELLLRRVAIEYETRVNPTWPMPGLEDCFAALRKQNLMLGIVSNAQFFTPELFPGLVGQSLEELGCEPELLFFSYQYGQAKPGRYLYQQAVSACQDRGLPAEQVLFVGNDMLNDVSAAAEVGLRTALFAGDQRSLRLREGDPRAEAQTPDLVVTDLTQIPTAIGAKLSSDLSETRRREPL